MCSVDFIVIKIKHCYDDRLIISQWNPIDRRQGNVRVKNYYILGSILETLLPILGSAVWNVSFFIHSNLNLFILSRIWFLIHGVLFEREFLPSNLWASVWRLEDLFYLQINRVWRIFHLNQNRSPCISASFSLYDFENKYFRIQSRCQWYGIDR